MNLNMRFIDTGCVMLLIAAVLAGGVLIQNKYSQNYSQIQREIDSSLALKSKLKVVTSTLEQLQSTHEKRENELKILNKKVPDSPNVGEFLRELHVRVKERNVTLIDFNHTPSHTFNNYKRIPVKIIVQGSFLNIYRLIHDLETMNRVVVFEQVEIQREEEQNFCHAVLMVHVFQQ